MNLYICSTFYHVLITVLKSIHTNKENAIAITGYIPEYDSLIAKLRKSDLFGDVIFLEQFSPQNDYEKEKWGKINVKKIEDKYSKLFYEYNEIYLFMDDICYARYLKTKHIYYNIIEDGFDCFKKTKMANSRFLYMVQDRKIGLNKKIYYLFHPYDYYNIDYYLKCKYVKTLEVNENIDLIINGKDKRVIEEKREQLFRLLDDDCKNVVIDIFLNDERIFKSDRIALVLTYCFYTDGKIDSEEKQVELYKRVCDYYRNKGLIPVIKPHPRDSVDYSCLNCQLLSKNFPAELIEYLDENKIIKYFSIYSSAIHRFDKIKVDYFETIDECEKYLEKNNY